MSRHANYFNICAVNKRTPKALQNNFILNVYKYFLMKRKIVVAYDVSEPQDNPENQNQAHASQSKQLMYQIQPGYANFSRFYATPLLKRKL